MHIKCHSCGKQIPVEWDNQSSDTDCDPVIDYLPALVLCGDCLDKVPEDDTINFFRHLTVEKQAIKEEAPRK